MQIVTPVPPANSAQPSEAMQIVSAVPVYGGISQSGQPISVYAGDQAQFAQPGGFMYSPYAHPNSQFVNPGAASTWYYSSNLQSQQLHQSAYTPTVMLGQIAIILGSCALPYKLEDFGSKNRDFLKVLRLAQTSVPSCLYHDLT
jgi:hypothetical protein